MNKFTKSLSGLVSVSTLAIGLAVIAQPALAGVVNSPHDMVASWGATGTTEVCVFCHTPHGANTSVNAPLWNKATTASSSYIMYNSATMDGTPLNSNLTVSLACLSCHDGLQARDNMINKPGSGGYNASGSPLGTLGTIGNGIVNLGTDLSNDHPIGMGYCGVQTATEIGTNGCPDDSFNASGPLPQGFFSGTSATRYWIDANATGTGVFTKTDLPLYGGNSTVGAEANVECATCHDPHSTTNATFLRVSNTGSGLCLTCHNK